jgi:lipoprotein-anchoring transpeptidase ErfK/SrfK
MFFVTDAVRITNPNGPWGPYAFGLSARSDTVTEFNGGDGIIGIHGTNRPNSIGEAQSLGCVRLPNDVMLELAELLSVGSPVTIKA